MAGVCLKDLRMNVPQAVARGDAVTLSCYYNLENVSISIENTDFMLESIQ